MFLLFVVVGMLWFLGYWLPRRRLCDLAEKIPGPKGLPILGNVPVLWGSTRQVFDNVVRLVEDFGPVVRTWIVNRLYVVLTDPDDVEQVIGDVNFVNKDDLMAPLLRYFIGNGILASGGDVWTKQRKAITPLFNTKVIESYFKIFSEKSKILENHLESVANGSSFDIFNILSCCTLDAICETVIGNENHYFFVASLKCVQMQINNTNKTNSKVLAIVCRNLRQHPVRRGKCRAGGIALHVTRGGCHPHC